MVTQGKNTPQNDRLYQRSIGPKEPLSWIGANDSKVIITNKIIVTVLPITIGISFCFSLNTIIPSYICSIVDVFQPHSNFTTHDIYHNPDAIGSNLARIKASFNSWYIQVAKTERGYNLIDHAIPVCDWLRSHKDNILRP